MVCGERPIEKNKQFQAFVLQNSVVTMVNSILNNC